MRLTKTQISTIKSIIQSYDKDAEIRLFGSRVDDTKRGGDIDLIVVSHKLKYGDKLLIRSELKEHLGDRKIDIIISSHPNTAFMKMAWEEGVAL